LLDKNNGQDISKFFHGGYSFEPIQGSANHAHSNYARTIVNSLIVARYINRRESVITTIESSQSISEYDTVKTFNLQVRGQGSGMLTGTKEQRIKNFYPDFDTMGKHYLVQRQQKVWPYGALGKAR